MRKNIKKVIGIIFILIFSSLCFMLEVKATGFSITSGISEIEIGKTYTISISASGLTGRFNITHSSNVSVNMDSIWVENGTPEGTIKVTANSSGKASVTLTPDEEYGVSDSEGLVTLSPQTDTVTVKPKETSSGGDNNKPSEPEDDTPSMSFTSTNKTMYATDSLNVRESYTTNSDVIGSLSVGQSVTVTGIGDGWTRISYGGQTAYVISSGLTSEKPKDESEEAKEKPDEKEQEEKENDEEDKDKSNVKTLSSLTVEQYKLEPEFDPDITEYAVTVGGDVEKLNIEAMAEDANSTIEILGNSGLLIGENTINIKVTAEDGTVRTYTINVTKVVDVGVQLSELSIENYTLTPEFSSDVYEYTLNIGDTDLTSLNINAKSDQENVSIEIAGNTELKLGKNIITILVTSNDDNLTTTYQIVVNIDEAYKQNTQIIAGIDDKDLFMYIGIGAAVLIVLIIIIVVIVKKRRNANEDDEDEDFSPLDTYDNNTFKDQEYNMGIANNERNSINPESTDLENNETEKTKNIEQEKDKTRKEKLEEFSSYASLSDSDGNTTSRRRGKHF